MKIDLSLDASINLKKKRINFRSRAWATGGDLAWQQKWFPSYLTPPPLGWSQLKIIPHGQVISYLITSKYILFSLNFCERWPFVLHFEPFHLTILYFAVKHHCYSFSFESHWKQKTNLFQVLLILQYVSINTYFHSSNWYSFCRK